MKIRVYQIDSDKDCQRMKCMPYKFSSQKGIDPSIYKKVFDGTIKEANSLEDVFTILNTRCVKGYKGHCLSMSDVVGIVKPDGNNQCHYVDRIGFKTFDFDTSKCIGG